jgi:ABC-type transport system substrate-binding protein
MASSRSTSPFPGPFLKQWYSGDPKRDVPQKANNWGGSNIFRWISPEFNTAYEQAIKETDPAKAKELWIKLNDLIVQSRVVIPLVERKLVSAASTQLKGPQLVTFDAETWNIADWSK